MDYGLPYLLLQYSSNKKSYFYMKDVNKYNVGECRLVMTKSRRLEEMRKAFAKRDV